MATTGTVAFNLNIEQILDEAMELAGAELTTGEDLQKARRALQLVLIDFQNKNHPLAELENKSFTTTSATAAYQLSAGIIDVMDAVVIRSSTTTPLHRIKLFEYHNIPTKDDTGLPTQFAVDRDRDQITMYLYQTPDTSSDTIDYWCLTQIEDVGSNYTNNLDMSTRYLPAIIFGTAYYMTLKRKPDDEISLQELERKRNRLKAEYEDKLLNIATEDRERGSFIVTPFNYR